MLRVESLTRTQNRWIRHSCVMFRPLPCVLTRLKVVEVGAAPSKLIHVVDAPTLGPKAVIMSPNVAVPSDLLYGSVAQ